MDLPGSLRVFFLLLCLRETREDVCFCCCAGGRGGCGGPRLSRRRVAVDFPQRAARRPLPWLPTEVWARGGGERARHTQCLTSLLLRRYT
ncbi:hypothetical protein STCU_10101 [Strigomonas culicis]|uniref:Secreted protein n=1 Tax=Strigomonas culicis TaxID=28005 RepID=S9TP76_9TRYP|nr:hypothetical protein STCU_10101 [Strigomonas culicis]|eukprot:EPY18238.1 hypothetical protein STCU_10101 [Strigomonas culicis]